MKVRQWWWMLLPVAIGCGPSHRPPSQNASPEVVATPPAPTPPRDLPTSSFGVNGLEQPVEIVIDRWGVPHIYAQTPYDVFVAQGFNAARDRLWQLDLWRRLGEGRLAEILGPEYLERDRAARLFLFRGDMHAEWLAYASDTKRIASAFALGVNAYIDHVKGNDELLPQEFKALGYRPGTWSAETLVRIRSHGLFGNAASEVSRALFLDQFGKDALALREKLEPAHQLQIPSGLDTKRLSHNVLRLYKLARSSEIPKPKEGGALVLGAREGLDPHGTGSNSWVIAPSRTTTGRPILANDPHRRVSVPSLRYIVHLVAPGLNVIGAGEPALPGVSIGHNERIAFGLTVFWIDQEDVLIYQTKPGKRDEIRYQGRWEPMRVVRELVPVRAGADQEIELKFTRHGPVVFEDPKRRLAVAVRAAWLQPGMAPYLGGVEYMRAKNWDQFLAAMNRWGAPSENQVYADVDGNIGWKPGGLAPIRANWDGLLPVPGDGRYEWQGFRDMDTLPSEANPSRGWIATANQMNLPKGYPHPLGFEWSSPYRFQRISEVLGATPKVSVADMVRLQGDYVSIPARRLLLLLRALKSDQPRTQRALALLQSWNASLDPQSGAAALFEIWYRRHLGQALLARVVSHENLRTALNGGHPEVRIRLLEQPDTRLGPNPSADRDKVLLESLDAAAKEAEGLLGPVWERWQWGSVHQANLVHPFAPLVEGRNAVWNVGPVARGGSEDTVCKTAYSSKDLKQRAGATFRMVIDVGDWDKSAAMNSPGQSGDPRTSHYKDLWGMWQQGRAFPLVYSRASVAAAAERRLLLEPSAR